MSKKRPRAPAPPPLPTLDELSTTQRALDDEDADEAGPGVVLATVRDLGDRLPDAVRTKHAARPVWFLAAADEPAVGVFERLPEGAFDPAASAAILGALRAISVEEGDRLQLLLGATERIVYGFHADASEQDVTESFEDDGFEVIDAIVEGHVAVEDDDEV